MNGYESNMAIAKRASHVDLESQIRQLDKPKEKVQVWQGQYRHGSSLEKSWQNKAKELILVLEVRPWFEAEIKLIDRAGEKA